MILNVAFAMVPNNGGPQISALARVQDIVNLSSSLAAMNAATICCDVTLGCTDLVHALDACSELSVAYKLLFFEESPPWVCS